MLIKKILVFVLFVLAGIDGFCEMYNIKDFGAVSDTTVNSRFFIQKAIDAAFEAGGGTVIVPPGDYMIGTIWLKSNVNLEIEGGATLFGSNNLTDYDSVRWGHNEDRCPYHLVMAKDAHNVTIQGQGTIDGQGWNWYDHTEVKPRWMQKHTPRPSPMVEFDNCTDVKVRDILLTNAAGWTMHTFNCDQVHITVSV